MFVVKACETQLKLLPVGLDNLNLIPEEARKAIYDASRKAPEGFEPKAKDNAENNKEGVRHQVNKILYFFLGLKQMNVIMFFYSIKFVFVLSYRHLMFNNL